MAGMLVGSFVFGLMADRFGRLLTLVAAATVLAGAGTLSAILPASMPLFTTLRYYLPGTPYEEDALVHRPALIAILS